MLPIAVLLFPAFPANLPRNKLLVVTEPVVVLNNLIVSSAVPSVRVLVVVAYANVVDEVNPPRPSESCILPTRPFEETLLAPTHVPLIA
jgi:hypothetical protein